MIPSVLVAVIAAPLRKPKAIRSLGGFWKDIGRADFRRTDLLTVIHIIIQFNRDTPCFQPLRIELFDVAGNQFAAHVGGSRAVRLCIPGKQLRAIGRPHAYGIIPIPCDDLLAVLAAVGKQLAVGIDDTAALAVRHRAERRSALDAGFLCVDRLFRQELLAVIRFVHFARFGIPVQQISAAAGLREGQIRGHCKAGSIVLKQNGVLVVLIELLPLRFIGQRVIGAEGEERIIARFRPVQFDRAVSVRDAHFIVVAEHDIAGAVADAPVARIAKAERRIARHLPGLDPLAGRCFAVRRYRGAAAIDAQHIHLQIDQQSAEFGRHVIGVKRDCVCFSAADAGKAACVGIHFKRRSAGKDGAPFARDQLYMRRAVGHHAVRCDRRRTCSGAGHKGRMLAVRAFRAQ